MAKFTLEIECDNAAFQVDGADVAGQGALPEVGRILEVIAIRLKRTTTTGSAWAGILDGNGKRVGAWDYTA